MSPQKKRKNAGHNILSTNAVPKPFYCLKLAKNLLLNIQNLVHHGGEELMFNIFLVANLDIFVTNFFRNIRNFFIASFQKLKFWSKKLKKKSLIKMLLISLNCEFIHFMKHFLL